MVGLGVCHRRKWDKLRIGVARKPHGPSKWRGEPYLGHHISKKKSWPALKLSWHVVSTQLVGPFPNQKAERERELDFLDGRQTSPGTKYYKQKRKFIKHFCFFLWPFWEARNWICSLRPKWPKHPTPLVNIAIVGRILHVQFLVFLVVEQVLLTHQPIDHSYPLKLLLLIIFFFVKFFLLSQKKRKIFIIRLLILFTCRAYLVFHVVESQSEKSLWKSTKLNVS